jgi:hypothetical protein
VGKPEAGRADRRGLHAPCLRQMFDERVRGRRIAVVQLAEQGLGLVAQVVEIGPGGEFLAHVSSMHRLGPQSGCTKVSCERSELAKVS